MRAAVYARISSDRSGEALGVSRQLDDCRRLIADAGWVLAGEYVDNDVSAHSGKVRPEYRRLLADIEDGQLDAVVVWDLDRLHRRPKELEEFIEVCDGSGMKQLRTVQGGADIGTTDGLFLARIMGAVAAAESDKKGQRVRRKMLQNAEAGLPHGGPQRPFGYEPDKVTIREAEAVIIRDLAARLLAGESLASLAKAMQESDVPTVNGGMWRPSTVRVMLYAARLSGQREHKGKIIGDAVWDAIITREQTERIRTLLDDPKRTTTRTGRRYLLAGGLVRCGRCDAVMVSSPIKDRRRYICKNDANNTGCGRTYITAERLEELIYEAVLLRLDTPELAAALIGQQVANADTVKLAESIQADDGKLAELAEMWADDAITTDEWKAARSAVEARRDRNRRTLSRLTATGAIDGLVGDASKLREQWGGLNLTRQQAIIRTVLDHAIIGPGPDGQSHFDPSRVTPVWRF